ncbi:chromosomal replication initiator protein DnaA [bacterium]|nr:chromosomal replication initiator protein DnaA [bacterium]
MAKPEPQKLFGSFVYQGDIKVQNTGFIKDTLRGTLGLDDNLAIKFKAVDQKFSEPSQPTSKKEDKKEDIFPKNPNLLLNPKYTFDYFVVGNSNRFAHAACLAVAQSPAEAYNPLFVYGENASEKTHLMQAIGNYIIQHNPKAKILYISSEKFTNELINSIRDDRTVAFRDKYRSMWFGPSSIDVLLIDDIQFLAGKKRAQVEFFHIFNTLFEANKQIVITSDRLPKDIANLEERLISCFEWGLTVDIPPPDFETRIAILRKKAQAENLNVPAEEIDFIAENISSNIRQLEEALANVISYSDIFKRDLSIPLAREVLKNIIPLKNKSEER